MRLAALVLFPLCGLALAEDASKETATLQGNWQVEEFTESGKKMELPAGFTAVITGSTFQIKGFDLTRQKVTLKLDNSTMPNRVDFVDDQGRLVHAGIYELDGDCLKFCYSIEGTRPLEFLSEKGSGVRFAVFRRQTK